MFKKRTGKSYPERDKRYYNKHKDKILAREKAKYASLSKEQKQVRLDKAKQRRHEKRDRELISKGFKDKYAKARSLGFRSMFEVEIATALDEQGFEDAYEYEPHYIPYVIKGSYKPDFVIKSNGIIIEVKGHLDAATARKMKAVKESNPTLDIRFVFYDANKKLNKRSKMRHWEWAEKYKFPWAEGRIPAEWLKEKPIDD